MCKAISKGHDSIFTQREIFLEVEIFCLYNSEKKLKKCENPKIISGFILFWQNVENKNKTLDTGHWTYWRRYGLKSG